MALTNIAVKKAPPKEKDYKLADEKGMYLLVTKAGSKYWRFKYRYANKEKLLALGVYPEVSLKAAREARDKAKLLLSDNIDPMGAKKAQKRAVLEADANYFQVIAYEWLEKEKHAWRDSHLKKQKGLLENNLLPYIGKIPVSDITPPILLDCLRKIEKRGAIETTRRCNQVAGQIFRYAIATGRAERDPSADLKGALKTPIVKHFASITEPIGVAALLRAIDGFKGSPTVKAALRLAPMLFVRPGELRQMEWSEVDIDKAEWRLPKEKMKMKQPHIVPLSAQAIEILGEQKLFSGNYQYVFPGERSRRRPMSDNALNAALRRLGYTKEEMTTHGFRAMARTLLDEELGFAHHLIEHQLAHEVRDPLGRAYNRTKHLPQRRKMMQEWSDYLSGLKKRHAN